MSVGIINYRMGNIGSVARAISLLGSHPVIVMEKPDDFNRVDKVILPGVGAFSTAMANLHAMGWVEAIYRHVGAAGMPVLGICLGMQLLADEGEENGVTKGLGLIAGRVVPLSKANPRQRIPHVGWNEVRAQAGSRLFGGIPAGTDFYFVHSYIFEAVNTADVAATSHHGVHFTAAVTNGNVAGTQFHPEKSSKSGARLLANFLEGHIA